MKKVYIAGSCRTAVGKMSGALGSVEPRELGAVVIREALKRAGVDGKDVDMVLMGCVLQAAHGQNIARQCTLDAGLPVEVPAVSLNVVCGSGLEAVNMGAALIRSGAAEIVVAGGVESMSLAAYALKKARNGYRLGDGQLVDTMVNDGLTDVFNQYHMGITAENVAEKWGLTRRELDEFAAQSQQKAEKAAASGRFKEEIVPVEIHTKKGTAFFSEDEGIRFGTTAESLAGLKPAFKKNGVVTAGNASGINDGAAAVVMLSEEKAKELGLVAEAEWISGALAGVEPEIMGIGPVRAVRKVMKDTGFSIGDFDLVEANEAFAAQAVAVARELKLDMAKTNVNGGAIALGHPIGASGCRILVTLLHEMKKRPEAKVGLATLCIGGGMGAAAVVRKVNP
jgi:acetyl-CoA C-acetyltransferase